jgi:hypothetical protein
VFARDSYGKAARERSPLRVSVVILHVRGSHGHGLGRTRTGKVFPLLILYLAGEGRRGESDVCRLPGGGSMRLRSGSRRGVAQHDHVAGGMVHDEACRVAQGLLPCVPRRVSCFAGEVDTKGLLEGRGDSRRGHARGLGHPGIPLRRVPSQRGSKVNVILVIVNSLGTIKKKCLKTLRIFTTLLTCCASNRWRGINSSFRLDGRVSAVHHARAGDRGPRTKIRT